MLDNIRICWKVPLFPRRCRYAQYVKYYELLGFDIVAEYCDTGATLCAISEPSIASCLFICDTKPVFVDGCLITCFCFQYESFIHVDLPPFPGLFFCRRLRVDTSHRFQNRWVLQRCYCIRMHRICASRRGFFAQQSNWCAGFQLARYWGFRLGISKLIQEYMYAHWFANGPPQRVHMPVFSTRYNTSLGQGGCARLQQVGASVWLQHWQFVRSTIRLCQRMEYVYHELCMVSTILLD